MNSIPKDHILNIIESLIAMPSWSDTKFDEGWIASLKELRQEIELYPKSSYITPLYQKP